MKTRILLAAAAVIVLCGAAFTWSHFHQPAGDSDDAKEKSPETAQANEGLVTLTDAKLASLDIRVEPAARRELQDLHVVPGRVQYDDTRHVEIRAGANGILTQVRVAMGDHVSAGQVLGVVSSPEIGLAHTEVHHCRERYELASKKSAWESEISQNVFGLIDGLKSRVPPDELEKKFRGRTLGKSRDQLVSAYARFVLAQKLASATETEAAAVLTAVTVEQRKAERRTAEAALLAACEQAGFDARQEMQKAEIETGDALRRLHIAEEQLTTLLGYSPDTVSENETAGDVLSRVEIRAPFAGTIEEKRLAQSERVRTSDAIFVLADTKTLWVAADIREQDWRAVAIAPGSVISITTPALPGRCLKAKVRHVGRQVVRETNSVPLIAEIANSDGLLRPGLFVRVALPVEAPKRVLCVPAAAVVQHEGAKLVFVRESAKTFRRVDVVTGMQTDDCIQIVRGLSEGAPVVVGGAMALKSEMLIEKLAKEE